MCRPHPRPALFQVVSGIDDLLKKQAVALKHGDGRKHASRQFKDKLAEIEAQVASERGGVSSPLAGRCVLSWGGTCGRGEGQVVHKFPKQAPLPLPNHPPSRNNSSSSASALMDELQHTQALAVKLDQQYKAAEDECVRLRAAYK